MKLFFSKPVSAWTLLILCSLFLISCEKSGERDNIIKTGYANLAEEITKRDFEGLWNFTDHENDHMRALAWKAVAKSETENLQAFINYAIQQDDPFSWFTLSLHPLTNEQIENLNQQFLNGNIQSDSVCEVFFRQGNTGTLNMLTDEKEIVSKSKICAQAVGGILSRIEVGDLTRRKVFDLAFNSDSEIIWRNLLYGFYRSPLNRPEPGSVLIENLSTMLDVRGESFSVPMDEYIVRIAGKAGFLSVMDRRSDRELNKAIQLSNELARNIILFESDELNHPHIYRLLRHPVDNVVAQVLQSLQEFENVPQDLLEMIDSEIASVTEDSEVLAEALNLFVGNETDIADFRQKMELMDTENEYLKHRFLPLFGKIESDEEYLERLQKEIREGEIGGLRAVQAVTNYFSENIQNNPELVETTRSIIRFALDEGDESVISALNTLLLSPKIFSEDDYEWMYDIYRNFVETSQWEKADVLNEVLSNRFTDRFKPVEIPEKPFRIPDWNRLYELGTQPIWVLETNKGTIEIQLDPLAAPFTVSSVDSLVRAGAYDNVPFHRVVRNFVIQGGDIDRKDGFGGPDYKLPTEPSFHSFERGMVGIASNGTDTEGSQFFIMLQWSPHLDGNYTLFGKVIRGMDVADRIQIGDRVLTAEIRR